MQTAAPEQNWGSAREVILGADPQLSLYGEVVVWFHKIELFRQHEEQRMYRQEPKADDLALHKKLLQRLIADGEHLVRLIEQHGFLPNADAVTAADVNATLSNLSADYRGWHEPMAKARREEVLREIFDVPQRPH